MKKKSRSSMEYKHKWMIKDMLKGSKHPISEEVRQTIGRQSTLKRMIEKRYQWIQQHKDEIEVLEKEMVVKSLQIRQLKESFNMNPIILYNRGRNKEYVQGKIWWYHKGFGLKKGMKEGKGNKKYHFFTLGRMDEMSAEVMSQKFDDFTDEDLMTEADWKQRCNLKFLEKYFPNLR